MITTARKWSAMQFHPIDCLTTTLGGGARPMYDVWFISYNEPNAEENWCRTRAVVPRARRLHGITGLVNAYRTAAHHSSTDWFFIIDGDNWLLEPPVFAFLCPDPTDRDHLFVWPARNSERPRVRERSCQTLQPSRSIAGSRWRRGLFDSSLQKTNQVPLDRVGDPDQRITLPSVDCGVSRRIQTASADQGWRKQRHQAVPRLDHLW